MEVSVKDIRDVYVLLNGAKLTKMGAKAQVKLVKIVRRMKSIVAPYEEYVKDAAEKLKGDNHAEMEALVNEWKDKGSLDKDNQDKMKAYWKEFNQKLDESLQDEFEKLHEVEFEKLTEDEFEQLITSNEFTVNQIIAIEDLIK